jgi:hypothetical protein
MPYMTREDLESAAIEVIQARQKPLIICGHDVIDMLSNYLMHMNDYKELRESDFRLITRLLEENNKMKQGFHEEGE